MNIHAAEFPVNQSRKAEGDFMSPVVHFAGEGMCTDLGFSSTPSLTFILFSAVLSMHISPC